MENLHLPHPNRIAVALPANLRSGRPADGGLEEADDWAPIERSYAGLPELTADWVAEHREALTLVDVRSEAEVQDPDGRIPGSLLIPPARVAGASRRDPHGSTHGGALPLRQPLRTGHATAAEEGAEPGGQPARRPAGLEGAGAAVGASRLNHSIALCCS